MRHLWRPLLALLVLGAAAAIAVIELQFDYRLDAFLPAPASPEQAIVVEQVAAGASSRLILAAIAGDDPLALAATSRKLAARWRRLDGSESVDNGDWSPDDALIGRLMQARFVLSTNVAQRVAPAAIEAALDDRMSDLALA